MFGLTDDDLRAIGVFTLVTVGPVLVGYLILYLFSGVGFLLSSADGLSAMVPPLIGFAICGQLHDIERRYTGYATLLAVIIFYMAMARGFYAHFFPAGEGFFTANRLVGIAMYALAFKSPWLVTAAIDRFRRSNSLEV